LRLISIEFIFEYSNEISEKVSYKYDSHIKSSFYYKQRRRGKVFVDPLPDFIDARRIKREMLRS
jgi:hypothetical protein